MLEDDLARSLRARSDRRPFHVEIGVGRDLTALVGRRIVGPDVEVVRRTVVGEVVELVLLPHRLRVGALPCRDAARGVALQMEEPDVGRHAAAVALPRARVGGVRRVREPFTARRDRAECTVGHGELFGEAALGRDGEKLHFAVATCESVVEEEELPVGRPIGEDFTDGMVGDARRHAARDGERVEVAVAVVVADEGDRLAVRAEARERFGSRRTRERRRHPALARHEPEIVGVDEDDLRRADVGEAQHSAVRLDLGGRGGGCDGEERGESDVLAHVGS